MVFCWASPLEVDALVGLIAIVPEHAGDLRGELVVQAVDQIADVVFDVADVQVLPAPVAGIENVHQVGQNIDDGLAAGQRLVAEVVDVPALGVGRDQRLGDLGQTFLQTNVGGHADTSRAE